MDNPNLVELLTRIRQESRELREEEMKIFFKAARRKFHKFPVIIPLSY